MAVSIATCMQSHWIDRAIARSCNLARGTISDDAFSDGDLVFKRVGRNHVYSVAHSGDPRERIFIKVALDSADFHREVLGHAIMKDLGRAHRWIGVVPLIATDESEGLIATRPAHGRFLASILRNSLRFDKNPFRRSALVHEARQSFELLNRWISIFRTFRSDDSHRLTDKTPEGIRQRALRNLQEIRSRSLPNLQGLDDLQDLLVRTCFAEEHYECGLLHGDLDPNNVLVADGQVTVIDFEDIGTGPVFYDSLWIQSLLSRSQTRWTYVWLRSALSALQIPPRSRRLEALYRIDFELLRLRAFVDRSIVGSGLLRITTRVGINSASRELRRLSQSLI